jgi:class 3 adenylate cyclase/YHS domain-containing protein
MAISRTHRPPPEPVLRRRKVVPPPSVRTPSRRIEATFGFIDLAGFTALTEAHGDDDAADVAARFAELTRAALGPGDRLIKTIGDAVLVASSSPDAALDLVESLLNSSAADKSLPSLRAGFNHGPAVERDGDVFGAAVNLAARVAAEAYAGEVLATKAVAAAAQERGLPVVEIGPIALKNVKLATVLSSIAFMVGAIDSAIDPVCQSVIDRRTAAGQLNHARKAYWFCSLTCAAAFASNPQWHVGGTKPPTITPPPTGTSSTAPRERASRRPR